jgi:hypothetical protein
LFSSPERHALPQVVVFCTGSTGTPSTPNTTLWTPAGDPTSMPCRRSVPRGSLGTYAKSAPHGRDGIRARSTSSYCGPSPTITPCPSRTDRSFLQKSGGGSARWAERWSGIMRPSRFWRRRASGHSNTRGERGCCY